MSASDICPCTYRENGYASCPYALADGMCCNTKLKHGWEGLPAPRMVNLDDVLAIVDQYGVAPDGLYYAKAHEQIKGWHMAAARIRSKLEELADDDE